MIRLHDRISTVLARDERLLDVLIGAAPVFEKLRNPLLRRTMTRLATVAQAARVAGIDANDLLERLNRALERKSASPGSAPRVAQPVSRELPPAFVAATVLDRILELDVHEDLRAGREPFGRILDAARRLPDGQVLRLRAIFEPAPLYAVLGRQGFEYYTEQLGPEDWRVWFHRSGVAAPEGRCTRRRLRSCPATPALGGRARNVAVRGMQPPSRHQGLR